MNFFFCCDIAIFITLICCGVLILIVVLAVSANPEARLNSVFRISSTALTMKLTTGSGVYHTPRFYVL